MTDVCPNCHAGALRLRSVTYADWHALEGSEDEQFVIIPRVPAWLCDVCGYKVFDATTIGWLAPLLGPTTESDDNNRLSFPGHEREWPSFDGDLNRGQVQ